MPFLFAAIAIAAGIIYLAQGATYASAETEIYIPPTPGPVTSSDSLEPMGSSAAGYGPDPSPDLSPAPAPYPLPTYGGGSMQLPPVPVSFSDSDVLDQAAELISGFESFSAVPYKDDYKPTPVIEYSIGYGHQIRPGEIFTAITPSQGRDLLSQDSADSWRCVKNKVGGAGLTLNQCVALTSLCFNIGCSNFSGSTLVRKINSGDLRGAAGEFSRWVYSGGVISQTLVTRRRQEQSLFERV